MKNSNEQKSAIKKVFERIPSRRAQWLNYRRHTTLKLIRFS